MTFEIERFYYDDNYGYVKFRGYSDQGMLLFDRYEKSFVLDGAHSGWLPSGQRVNIDKEFQLKRLRAGKIRPSYPPQ